MSYNTDVQPCNTWRISDNGYSVVAIWRNNSPWSQGYSCYPQRELVRIVAKMAANGHADLARFRAGLAMIDQYMETRPDPRGPLPMTFAAEAAMWLGGAA